MANSSTNQEIYNMSLEHLMVVENKEVTHLPKNLQLMGICQ